MVFLLNQWCVITTNSHLLLNFSIKQSLAIIQNNMMNDHKNNNPKKNQHNCQVVKFHIPFITILSDLNNTKRNLLTLHSSENPISKPPIIIINAIYNIIHTKSTLSHINKPTNNPKQNRENDK